MDQLKQLADEIVITHDFESLSVLIPRIIKDVDKYHQELVDQVKDISMSMNQLTLDESNLIGNNREIAITKAKIEIVDKTLSSLNVSCEYLLGKPYLKQWLDQCYNQAPFARYIISGGFGLRYDIIIGLVKSFIKRVLRRFFIQMEALNSGFNSPFDLLSIIDKLLKSLSNNSSVSTKQVESLFKLVQSELVVIKEAKTLNDSQRILIGIYREKLNILESELSSVNKETVNKPKQRNKKLRDIVNGIRLIIKDTFELVEVLESVDWINESDEIFNTINEKGIDAFDYLIDYMEKIKTKWIEKQTDNATQKICRLAALRRINVEVKKAKKLRSLSQELEPSWIILGMQNLIANFNNVHHSSNWIDNNAYYLTHKSLPKPRIDVPEGFIRDDMIYNELNVSPHHGLVVVFVHIIIYLQNLEALTWNAFQNRKPKKVTEYFSEIFDVISRSNSSFLDDNELHQISFDLADRYYMTKQKIATDRDALEYRLFRYKPQKSYKFGELQKQLNSQHGKQYKVFDYIEEHFDEMLNDLNRKVVNCGQVIIYKRAVDMMKRSLYTFKQIRWDCIRPEDRYLIDLLVDQSANEFCYAAEIVVKLLDQFRSNRRIPFSFNADGQFTKQIDLTGLKVKDEFEKKVDTLIEKLKLRIKEKEEDLETIKEEKTQLRYLTSIVKRSKLIPINELELSEQDELEILKEIIEEYEYTILTYGPVY